MLRFTSLCKFDHLYREDDEKILSYLAENVRDIKKSFFIIKSISKTNVYRTIDRNKQNRIIKYTYLTL